MNKKINEKINEKELGFGNPFQVAVVQNIGAIQDKTILVIRDYLNAIWYARRNKVIYLTDNEDLFNKFNNEIVDKKFGSDDKAILINNFDSELNTIINNLLMELNMPKFDVIIGNPPYDGVGRGNPLYLEILEYCNKKANEVVWLCPSQWVKNYKDEKYLQNIKSKTCANLINHCHISNPFNDAILGNELGIYHFGISDKYENYDDIRLERFKNAKLAKSIWNKFNVWNEKFGNIDIFNKKDLNKKYYVSASWIRGNVHESKPLWDWTTLFNSEQRNNFNSKPADKEHSPSSYWNFNSINECKNFVSACETDILMFALYISKINTANNNKVLSMIPWLGDYKHEWSEDMIAKELGLTAKEVEYIHEEMKGFGWKAQPTTRKKRERK